MVRIYLIQRLGKIIQIRCINFPVHCFPATMVFGHLYLNARIGSCSSKSHCILSASVIELGVWGRLKQWWQMSRGHVRLRKKPCLWIPNVCGIHPILPVWALTTCRNSLLIRFVQKWIPMWTETKGLSLWDVCFLGRGVRRPRRELKASLQRLSKLQKHR